MDPASARAPPTGSSQPPRRAALRAELERATFGIDEDVLSERIGSLSGKVAVIRVGAPTNAELAVLTLGDVPQSPDRERLRARRAELGLPAVDEAPLIVDPFRGEAVDVQALPLHLRRPGRPGLACRQMAAYAGVCCARGMRPSELARRRSDEGRPIARIP